MYAILPLTRSRVFRRRNSSRSSKPFATFLHQRAFKPSYDVGPYPDRASCVIGGRAGESSRPSPLAYRDILGLSYKPDDGFRLRLTRITDQMSDFSDQYLSNFVTQ